MKIVIKETHEEASNYVAELIKKEMQKKKNKINLGLATGDSPLLVYKNLVDYYRNGEISFENVKTFNLDEYIGLDNSHPLSYHYYMHKNLFDKVNMISDNIFIPSGQGDFDGNAVNYEKAIKKHGPVDIQILGIGVNGHIGFNEPGSAFDSLTRKVKLTNSTILANSRFFDNHDDVPKFAISMGIDTIMRAKKIILIANGKSKEEAIFNTVNTEPTIDIPSTVLQNHPNVEIVVDKLAGKLLKKGK